MNVTRQRSKNRARAKDKRDLECLREMIRKVRNGEITSFAYGQGQLIADSEPILLIQTTRCTEDATKYTGTIVGFLDDTIPTEKISVGFNNLSIDAFELAKIAACSSVICSGQYESTASLQWYELN